MSGDMTGGLHNVFKHTGLQDDNAALSDDLEEAL